MPSRTPAFGSSRSVLKFSPHPYAKIYEMQVKELNLYCVLANLLMLF